MKTKPKKIFDTTDKSAAQKTEDGFQNFVAKLGVSPQGSDEVNNLLSKGHYQFNLVTRNRVSLEAAYRGSWIVGQVIDTFSEDMTRAGIDIQTNEGAEEVTDIENKMSGLSVWQSVCDTLKWGRLYGGACAVLQIKGQNLEDPIDLDTVGQDDFLGLVVYDRWQLYPVLDKLINEGPQLGLPAYYDIVLGSNLNDPGREPGGQITDNPNQRVRVHHSRCIRIIGIQLPFWQAITEMMWGESVLERMWDRLIMFDDATLSTGNLISRAQLRTVGVDGLREIMAAGGEAQEGLIRQFEYMRQLQNNEGITIIDKEDTFQSTAYSFAGLSDVLIQFGQQVSGACGIPLVRLFGQSPAGMNATGESDIRLYYDGVNAKQESLLRNPFEILLKVLWRSVTGHPAPDDLSFTFTPLWQMSATDKATVAKTNTDTIIEAHAAGAVDTSTMMKELKQSSGDTGLFTHITDEQIDEAENDEPPMPESGTPEQPVPGTSGKGEQSKPGAEPIVEGGAQGTPGEGPAKEKAKDSAWKKVRRWLSRDANEKREIEKLREEAEKQDDKNNHHEAERLREKARKLEKEIKSKDKKAPVNDPGVAGTMKEFYNGTLKSSSGKKVTSKKQAAAIGYSEEGEKSKDAKVSDDQKYIRDWLKR